MSPDKDRAELEARLSGLESGPVCFVPNPGNAGDSVIAEATYQLFDRLGLSIDTLTDSDPARVEGRIVILGGGGSLVPLYSSTRPYLESIHTIAEEVIVLPQTIRGMDELLGQLGANVTLYCREKASFDHVTARVTAARVRLAPDMAFDLNAERQPHISHLELLRHRYRAALSDREGRFRIGMLRAAWGRPVRHAIRHLAYGSSGVLNAFRLDHERTDIPIPPDNIDVSGVYSFGTSSREMVRLGAALFVDMIDRFEEVRTNRLHVAVVGAVLGKQVILHANSYDKNQSVYDYSMRDRYANVRFIPR